MKSLTLLLSFAFVPFLTFSHEPPAETNPLDKVIKQEEKPKSSKRKRRKKVEMCAECGKPEPQCDCEGH